MTSKIWMNWITSWVLNSQYVGNRWDKLSAGHLINRVLVLKVCQTRMYRSGKGGPYHSVIHLVRGVTRKLCKWWLCLYTQHYRSACREGKHQGKNCCVLIRCLVMKSSLKRGYITMENTDMAYCNSVDCLKEYRHERIGLQYGTYKHWDLNLFLYPVACL